MPKECPCTEGKPTRMLEEDVKIGIIVGVLIGVLFFVIIVVVIVYCYCGQNRNKPKPKRSFSREGLHMARPGPIKMFDSSHHCSPFFSMAKNVDHISGQLPKVGSSGLWMTSSSILAQSPPQICRQGHHHHSDHPALLRVTSEPKAVGQQSHFDSNMRLYAGQPMAILHEAYEPMQQREYVESLEQAKRDHFDTPYKVEVFERTKLYQSATNDEETMEKKTDENCRGVARPVSQTNAAVHRDFVQVRPTMSCNVGYKPPGNNNNNFFFRNGNDARSVHVERATTEQSNAVNHSRMQQTHCQIEPQIAGIRTNAQQRSAENSRSTGYEYSGRSSVPFDVRSDAHSARFYNELKRVIKTKSVDRSDIINNNVDATTQQTRTSTIEPSVSNLVDIEAKYITAKAFQFLDNYLAEDDEMSLVGTKIWNDKKEIHSQTLTR